jgi:hypothetical protein
MAPQYVVYALDDSIKTFFQDHTDATRQDCDDRARSLVRPPVEPVPIQGEFSYTVTAGDSETRKIVQFRAGISDLDMTTMRLARTVHPQFVPDCSYHGTIASSSPLSVYVMEEMTGITYIKARGVDRRNTVVDLAS